MAVAAVGVRPIAEKLQALAGSSPSVNLVHVAAQHTQVGLLRWAVLRWAALCWAGLGSARLDCAVQCWVVLCDIPHLCGTSTHNSRTTLFDTRLHNTPAQVGELASRMHGACEQQYLATMGLLLDMQRAVNPVVRAFWR